MLDFFAAFRNRTAAVNRNDYIKKSAVLQSLYAILQ